jgi:hypothetical protein
MWSGVQPMHSAHLAFMAAALELGLAANCLIGLFSTKASAIEMTLEALI